MRCPECNAETSADSLYCHKCGASLSTKVRGLPADATKDFGEDVSFFFAPGERFGGRYKIIEELGRGGMGRVYKAEDTVLNTVVALKMIRPEFLADSRMIHRFKTEILLAREIAHENVVRIYDFGELKGVKFISMQYIEGKSLKELIEQSGPLPIEKVKKITKNICMGLSAAHKKGIVHRDLKPHNIMIDKNDNVYITDFGLAISTGASSIDQFGSVVGTPQYIAPEQWMGEKVDYRSDIYTLGIIMYEMITGRQPFVADSDIGYFQKHLKEKPVFPKTANLKVPGLWKKIIYKCLEKRKEYRYRQIEEILSDIEAGTFLPGSIISRFRKLRMFKKVTASLLMLLTLYGIYRLVENVKEKDSLADPAKQRSLIILPFHNRSKDKDLNHLGDSISFLLQTDLSQSKFLRVLPENRLHDILKEINVRDGGLYSTEVYNKIIALGNVNFIIKGSFIKAGEKLRITVTIWDSRRQHETASTSVDTEEDVLFSAVDRLTLKIKKKFNFSRSELYLDSETDKAVETFASTSKEAFALYVKGKVSFNEEEYEESIDFFRQAIKKDPGFALAYKDIAWAYAFLPDIKKRREFFRLALEHSSKLPEKERLLIEGYYYIEDEKTYDKAVASFEKILKIYPDDYEANFQMGTIFLNVEEWDRAIGFFKRVNKETNPDFQIYGFLARAYMKKGMLAKAREVIDNYHKVFFKKTRLLCFKYDSYLIEDNIERAAVIREDIAKINGDSRFRQGEIHFFRDELKEAEREFREMIIGKDAQSSFEGIRNLKKLFLVEGKFEKSIELLNKAINLAEEADHKIMLAFELVHLYLRLGRPQKALVEIKKYTDGGEKKLRPHQYKMKAFYKCLVYLNSGQSNELQAALDELKNYLDNSVFKNDIKYYYYVKGKIEEKNKNVEQAIIHFEKAASYLPFETRDDYYVNQQALFRYELAAAYYKAGDMEKAGSHFDRITRLTFGRYYFGDLYAKSFYFLGKIYQERGWKGKALEKYETFLRLWRNSDPGVREKEKQDARQQLKEIKG
ncbi:MAG: protein kinase [Candidatus Aminicenantes bacterium]|nr:protein kinase [Candidatus Aminicenantes bacterium]